MVPTAIPSWLTQVARIGRIVPPASRSDTRAGTWILRAAPRGRPGGRHPLGDDEVLQRHLELAAAGVALLAPLLQPRIIKACFEAAAADGVFRIAEVELVRTVAATLDSLRRIVSQVRSGADEIQTASQEVATASVDLSRRTEETAAQLQRTSAAMTEISGTVENTAQTAAGASDLVARNAAVAEQGGVEVGRAVSTMGEIQASSARIGEIVKEKLQ